MFLSPKTSVEDSNFELRGGRATVLLTLMAQDLMQSSDIFLICSLKEHNEILDKLQFLFI